MRQGPPVELKPVTYDGRNGRGERCASLAARLAAQQPVYLGNPVIREDYLRKVAAAIATVEDNPSLAADIGYSTDIINEVGLDSLKMTDFILGLEDDFGISIDFDKVEYETFTRVDRLIDFLIEATGAPAPSPVAS